MLLLIDLKIGNYRLLCTTLQAQKRHLHAGYDEILSDAGLPIKINTSFKRQNF